MVQMIRVIHVPSISFVSINSKYVFNPRTHRLATSSKFKKFKSIVDQHCLKGIVVNNPIRVDIQVKTYLDIDNFAKCVIDIINDNICNDRNILELHIYKFPIKRGLPGELIVDIEEIK